MDYSEFDPEGYWSPITSNNEWCEENYAVTHYVAEFWNTTSNIVYILVGLVTALQARVDKAETRNFAFGLSLLIVGLGSWSFHMTLRYTTQMLDAIPMLWLVGVGIYVMTHIQMPRKKINYPILISLLLIVTVVSIITAVAEKPLFFHITFAILVIIDLILCIRSIRKYDCNPNYILSFVVLFLFAAGVWMIDRRYCDELRSFRSNHLPPYLQPLTQLHAWWHILTGIATMFNIFFVFDMRSRYLRLGTNIKMKWYIVPYMEQNRWTKECA